MPMELGDQVELKLPNAEVNVIYGMSEVAGALTVDYPRSKNESAGKLVPGVKAKIIDENGNRCGVNIDGEVCIETPSLFSQYFSNEEATVSSFDSDGYFHTGDVGHFDSDGYFYFVDRSKDIIKYRGYQISPTEIEFFLINLDGIRMACVVGIAEDFTEIPAALIVRTDERLTVDGINRKISGKVKQIDVHLK